MKKRYRVLLCLLLAVIMLTGCKSTDSKKTDDGNLTTETTSAAASSEETTETGEQEAVLEDGVYTVDFDTDSGMFHVSEACEGKGTLTVTEGNMMLHISLGSKKIVNLFPGPAADAEKEGAELLWPTTDTVTYQDGLSEEVFGFDVPVPVLEEEFDLALIGTKGKWYDHKVSVSNPVKREEEADTGKDGAAASVSLEDGEYAIDVTLEGGSGKASVSSPAVLLVKDGRAYARIEWSSPNYDYMKIGSTVYDPVNTEGNSVFELPVSAFDEAIEVVADTVAMGTPHEIEYTLTFQLDSAEKEKTE